VRDDSGSKKKKKRSVEVIDTKVNKKLHYQNIVELRICIFPFLNLQ